MGYLYFNVCPKADVSRLNLPHGTNNYRKWKTGELQRIGRHIKLSADSVRQLSRDFKAKMHKIRFRLGLRPRPRWGSLQGDLLQGLRGGYRPLAQLTVNK